ncbi:MAG TPA: Clp protease N-terminal domain-containing protein [Chthonomonadaceae bacterium]|nr:Clp protease N-terminal domain-containing protein [Chthonomonadaceae bacterium]
MWQRFTERARRVVFFAQEEAGRLGENYVSTEHLLLGLIRENDSVAARVLDTMGVSLGRIRKEIERQVTRGDGRLQDMQLTPRAKRVIDLAYDEARNLGNNYIGTEHLLLGLIREGEGLAGRVLAKLGVTLETTRLEIKTLQDSAPATVPTRTLIAQEWKKLSEEQQYVLQAVGMPFGELPPGLQKPLETLFLTGSLHPYQMDLSRAVVRLIVEANEQAHTHKFTVSLITSVSIQLDEMMETEEGE